jgi:ribosomal protein L11 methyltransferase
MIALVVSVTADHLELASDALWALGVVAIEERRAGELFELWTSLGDDESVVRNAAMRFDPAWGWRIEHVDETVADTWREHAVATWVDDDLVVVPAWIDPPETMGDDDVVVLFIEPGSTFGLGDHPTTTLSLLAVREAVRARPGCAVLDVGCGSGVLAVAAVRLGAAHASGIDIAPAAVAITMANARANGVGEAVTVSNESLDELDGTFDVVVANILAPVLIALAADLVRLVAPGGSLIVSGILSDRHDHVVAALSPFVVVARADSNGWAALTLQR